MELLRSLIFVPGNRIDMLEKARDFEADAIVPDLEDSVPPDEKLNARRIVKGLAPGLSSSGKKVLVRVNSLDTGLTQDELSDVVGPHLYGVSLGKVESPWEIHEFGKMASTVEAKAGLRSGHIKLIPWIENARGVIKAYDIASASERIIGVAFGPEDLTDDMGVRRTDTGEEVHFARAYVATAARAARVTALDGPYARYKDQEGLGEDIKQALKLGYKGKFAIHPAQLSLINSMFSPSREDIEYARKVVHAWGEAEASGKGSTSLDGHMIDVPVVRRARNLLALAEEISQSKRA